RPLPVAVGPRDAPRPCAGCGRRRSHRRSDARARPRDLSCRRRSRIRAETPRPAGARRERPAVRAVRAPESFRSGPAESRPQPWRYELIEAWYPNTLWNPLGRDIVVFGDHEGFVGRKTYASIGGCYYAARLAVGEALVRQRRQAATVILRETHPGYIMPVGVW